MKKTLVSALTAALVVGAASTTFAAANPFSDVPADHWAYDAVSQLAADGVIEGYGDTTFQGDKNITRYEMAQMIAKAMAKNTATGNDKALLDKLAAEFSDELNNLGVRVSNLERNADMVKWNGLMRVDAESERHEGEHMTNKYPVKLRLEPKAEINSNWHVIGRIDANGALNTDSTEEAKLQRVYAQGDYKNFQVQLGKVGHSIDNVLLYDGEFSGATLKFGNKLKATLEGGRWSGGAQSHNDYAAKAVNNKKLFSQDAANFAGIGLSYKLGKASAGASYTYLESDDLKAYAGYSKNNKEDKAGTWGVNGYYRFDNNTALGGMYAENTKADAYEKAGSVEFDYKGAKKADQGTWGAYLAYRHLGQNVSFNPFYNGAEAGWKGIEVGANYTPFKNVVAQVHYFDGKTLEEGANRDRSKLFGRVEFFF